ncbi:hypothetical protein V6N13_113806 [Hibiscus sabdariffa]
MLGMDFSIKRARIFINSLYFIEESVSLSCNGSCFTIKIREFNEDGWTSSVVDGFCIKNGDSINSLVKMDGPGRCSPVGSSSSSSTISKSIQFWNVEGFVYSRVGGGVVNESVLEPSNVLMKEYSLGGCSFYKEGLTEVDLVLGRDKNYDASYHTEKKHVSCRVDVSFDHSHEEIEIAQHVGGTLRHLAWIAIVFWNHWFPLKRS